MIFIQKVSKNPMKTGKLPFHIKKWSFYNNVFFKEGLFSSFMS